MNRHRAVILPTVMFVLLLLGLFGAMFAFRINADVAATHAVAARMQTRLAAEAGLERVKLLLQSSRNDMETWYHNPDELNRIIIWAHDIDPTIFGTDEDLDEGTMAYRFSVVADDPTDDDEYIRFGVTDESSKLNLNTATRDQLLILVRAAIDDDEEVDPLEIVGAILDWRDQDSVPQTEEGDTEGTYYEELDKPYKIRNGPFDSVEELLLVKGITAQILYGEDVDRNGLMTPNEDDGDTTFPSDNQDNALNRGLYPYLTVYSYENNVSNDNRRRIYLFGDENAVREECAAVFEDEPDVVDYIVTVTRGQGPARPGRGQGTDRRGNTGTPGKQPTGSTPVDAGNSAITPDGGDSKAAPRQQAKDAGKEDDENGAEGEGPVGGEAENGQPGDEVENPNNEQETNDAGPASGPIRTPAALLLPRSISGELREGPVGPEHLAALLDRTTVVPPDQQRIVGLINVNTAPALVLRCLDLNDEQVRAIVATRDSLDGEEKSTPAWLVTEEVVDLVTFERLAPRITARGQQFTIEVLGFADHLGMVTRLQAIVDLVGPIAETLYYRDVTHLGGAFPIREEDKENIRVK